ncbi:hypothetical protein J4206_07570 [Candidatus Woesearchaeota archaeon]|nr:hypothetical protein [Candidatus Woesearchaeota archaeon]
MITHLMIRCMVAIVKDDSHSIKDISNAVKASYKKTAIALQRLEREDLIIRTKPNKTHYMVISNNNIGKAFIDLCHKLYYLDLSSLLFGAKLEILNVLSIEEGIPLQIIAKILKKAPKTISLQIKLLKKKFVVYKKEGKYYINKKIYQPIYNFVNEYRLYLKSNYKIYWKLNDEMLFESYESEPKIGTPTGYMLFGKWGVKYGALRYFLYHPKKEITKEDAFIHALHKLSDPRDLAISITFYLKNKMNAAKLEFLSMYYGVSKKYHALLDLINDGKLSSLLPKITKRELIETLELYDVNYKLRWSDVKQE